MRAIGHLCRSTRKSKERGATPPDSLFFFIFLSRKNASFFSLHFYFISFLYFRVDWSFFPSSYLYNRVLLSLFSWNGSFRISISISLAACGLSIMNTLQLFSSFRLSFCFCLPNEPTYSGVGKVFQLLFNCIPSDDGSTLRNFSKTKLLVQKYLF